MYTLYWSPGSASMPAHGALEEAGVKYDLKLVDLDSGAQHDAAYLKLNPNGKVPTLVYDGGKVMFEVAAIAMFIADRHPEARLAPPAGDAARAPYYQWMTHLTNSLQPAMLRYYYPERHTADAKGEAGVKDNGMEEVATLWGRIDRHLQANGPHFLGAQFSAVDLLAHTLSTWQQSCPGIYERFAGVKRMAELVAARPAMQRVLKQNQAA